MNIKKAALTVLSITLKIVILALVLMLLMRLGREAYFYGHSVFHTESLDAPPGRQVTVSIGADDSVMDIGRTLQEEGLIEDGMLFYLQARLSKYYETMLPGKYTLTTAMTPKEMMAVLSGEIIEEEDDEES